MTPEARFIQFVNSVEDRYSDASVDINFDVNTVSFKCRKEDEVKIALEIDEFFGEYLES